MRLTQYINEEGINDIKQHLKDRGLDFKRTKVFMDTKTNTAMFMLYNLSGKLVGYQQYNPNGSKSISYSNKNNKNLELRDLMKYYSYITMENDRTKQIAVYGLESYNPKSKVLFAVEGIFDAIKLHNQGLSAVAVLANDPKPFKEWFDILPQKIIVIQDNDDNKSGNKLAKFGNDSYTVPDPFNDLGDMSDNEVRKFLKDNKLL